MPSLVDAVNAIIGTPTATAGFRWAVNHSATSAPGATATHQLTFDRKNEAVPIDILMDGDAEKNFPGVFFEIVGNFPETNIRGKHGECSFTVKITAVAQSANNTRPKESGRALAAKITENVIDSDKLGLDWVDSVEWRGLTDDPFTQQLHLVMPKFYAGSTVFTAHCKGLEL